jgi:hypothetical protein
MQTNDGELSVLLLACQAIGRGGSVVIFYRYQVKREKEVKLVAARCPFEAKAHALQSLASRDERAVTHP